MSKEVKVNEVKEETAVKPAEKSKKSKVAYFKNSYYSALKILVRGGKDDLDGLGVKESERFTPYYDTFKGDVVRVGYLRTESEEVAKRCREDSRCEEIDEKEYNLVTEGDSKTKPLEKAPIPTA
jgi:hypothetical protein